VKARLRGLRGKDTALVRRSGGLAGVIVPEPHKTNARRVRVRDALGPTGKRTISSARSGKSHYKKERPPTHEQFAFRQRLPSRQGFVEVVGGRWAPGIAPPPPPPPPCITCSCGWPG
jgi:hypothetical protein